MSLAREVGLGVSEFGVYYNSIGNLDVREDIETGCRFAFECLMRMKEGSDRGR